MTDDAEALAAQRRIRRAWRDADQAMRGRLVAQLIRDEAARGGEGSRVLGLARMDIPAMRAGAEEVLAAAPDDKLALRIAAWCLNRMGEFDAARALLRRLLADGKPRRDDSRREVLRLEFLSPSPDPAQREAAWRDGQDRRGTLSDLSYAVQRRVAEGAPPDAKALESAIAAARAEGLARAARQPRTAAAIGPLGDARSVALVGNGPSLVGRGAGAAIDAHEIVIRFNYPLLAGFAADVGARTDLMVFSGAKRPQLPKLLAREPGFASLPAFAIEAALPGATPLNPPGLPGGLMSAVVQLGYGRPTTGFAAILLVSLLLDRPATLYGFDFFPAGAPGHYFGDAAAAASHEIAYERWFVERVLPRLRPGLRVFRGG